MGSAGRNADKHRFDDFSLRRGLCLGPPIDFQLVKKKVGRLVLGRRAPPPIKQEPSPLKQNTFKS